MFVRPTRPTLRINLLMLGLWMTPTSDQAENPLFETVKLLSVVGMFFLGGLLVSKQKLFSKNLRATVCFFIFSRKL